MYQFSKQKMKIYHILPTHGTTVAGQYSKNLGLLSHLPFVAYTSQAESLPQLGRVLPILEKACVGLLSFEFLFSVG
jgi:hypothetical protein